MKAGLKDQNMKLRLNISHTGLLHCIISHYCMSTPLQEMYVWSVFT